MKTEQFFYGIKAPERRKILADGLSKYPLMTKQELLPFDQFESLVFKFWQGKSREEMYIGLELMEKFRSWYTADTHEPKLVSLFQKLVKSATWWDLLDTVPSSLSRFLLLSPNRKLHEEMIKSWSNGKKNVRCSPCPRLFLLGSTSQSIGTSAPQERNQHRIVG